MKPGNSDISFKKDKGQLFMNLRNTKECISKASLLKNLPYPLFAKEGSGEVQHSKIGNKITYGHG